MKIIHSLWSKPSLISKGSKVDRNLGGWSSQKYHWFSWALSCLSIKKFYPKIELVTDTYGKNLLIDKLQLPYSSVSTSLDLLDNYSSDLFTIGKLYAYSLQNEPFLHVDSDVYIWKRFSQEIEQGRLVAQNEETNIEYDQKIFEEINRFFSFVPPELTKLSELRSSNAGIFGGTDLNFFKNYVKIAFDFINNNEQHFSKLSQLKSFHIVYEQYLFASMAKHQNIEIKYLFPDFDYNYNVLAAFEKVPKDTHFIHLLGPFKKQKDLEIALENRLLLEYPDYYYRIIKLLDNYEI